MELTEQQARGLGVALEEAVLLGLEVDAKKRIATATFAVWTLPETGPVPKDRRVQFMFTSVGRIAASLRKGLWNDPQAEVSKFRLEELPDVVQSFEGLPIYGLGFFDVPVSDNFDRWIHRSSLDLLLGQDGQGHTLDLFQARLSCHLDIRLWFDDFYIRNSTGAEITLTDFIGDGRRWWERLLAGDKRTDEYGMYPYEYLDLSELDKPWNSVDYLLNRLVRSLSSRDWEDHLDDSQTIDLRKSLMREIVRQGEKSVAPLLEYLHHDDWAVRDDIAMLLGFIKDQSATGPLIITMTGDKNLSVRMSAAAALERIGTSGAQQAAEQWYIANSISAKQRVGHKLAELSLYGETDPELMQRIARVASSRGTTSSKVVQAWLLFEGARNPPPSVPEWAFRLTPEECVYLEASRNG